MTFGAGAKLGAYEIVALLGAGGMGEVYRARDTKLGRDVALKVLPDAFAGQPDRLMRFRREAQALAALNHPSIAAIYGLEESKERTALVLELVEGETLADRLRRGAILWSEALPIAKQTAEALEAAHEKGLMHRDLKPANIKITPDGKVKVLDFGLAKVFADPAEDVNLSQSPTLITGGSAPGMILGTAAYMSPEQARGKTVDKRADIWALGCVLYEMLTGRPAFAGDSVSEILAGVIKGEPDWSALPADVTRRVRDLVQRCLRKDPRQRVHDAADVRIEIEEVLAQPGGIEPPAVAALSSRHRFASIMLAVVAGVAIASVGWWLLSRSSVQPQGPLRLAIPVVPDTPSAYQSTLAPQISPDGKTIVYAVIRDGTTQLMLRRLDQYEAKPVAGTEGGSFPFFSSDGQWVGFFLPNTTRELKKIPISGGSPITICSVSGTGLSGGDFVGASWGSDDRIVFVPTFQSGIWSVPSSGGTPQLVLDTDVAKDRIVYTWPQVLPDGRGILFGIGAGRLRSMDDAQVAVIEPGAKEPRIVIQGGSYARYLPTGHLVYARGGSLLAVRFDLSRLEVAGTPIPVVEGVPLNPTGGIAHYSVSNNGTLLYLPGGAVKGDNNLVLIDRKGNIKTVSQSPAFFGDSALSPDGRRVVARIFAANDDLWTLDTAQGTPLRLTSEPGDEMLPVWTPDGIRIAFGWRLGGTEKVFWKPADGTGDAEELSRGEHPRNPGSFSPDGKTLAFVETHPSRLRDIWTMPLTGDRKAQSILATNADEWAPRFSRDGRWIAYVSNETGRNEIYVRPATTAGARKQISTDGGAWPIWSHNGKEIFYINDRKLMSAAMDLQSGSAGKVSLVLELKSQPVQSMFDVMPDDQHFLMSMTSEHPAPTHYNVILNWFEELQKLVPAR